MNAFTRRDQIMDDFNADSRGSFSIVYRALSQISNEKKTAVLDVADVRERIRKLVREQDARKQKSPLAN